MSKDSTIVILDDLASEWIKEIIRPLLEADNFQIVTFTEDKSAARFVSENASRIVGYIQDREAVGVFA